MPFTAPVYLAGGTGRLKPPVAPGTPDLGIRVNRSVLLSRPLLRLIRFRSGFFVSFRGNRKGVLRRARLDYSCAAICHWPRRVSSAGGTGRLKPPVAPGTPDYCVRADKSVLISRPTLELIRFDLVILFLIMADGKECFARRSMVARVLPYAPGRSHLGLTCAAGLSSVQ